jgi:hypothetical protein
MAMEAFGIFPDEKINMFKINRILEHKFDDEDKYLFKCLISVSEGEYFFKIDKSYDI